MIDFITGILKSMGGFGIVFLMILENLFPPIPSELILPLAGFMVSQNEFTFAGDVAAAAGSLLEARG